MDKKQLLSSNLARIMVGLVPQVSDLVEFYKNPTISYKSDGSPITPLDLKISLLLEKACRAHFPGTTFYSEENFSKWEFPMMVVDPLDGTKEYIMGRPEWSVSVALLKSMRFEGEGWIYNPIKGEIFEKKSATPFLGKTTCHGEVSRTEWERGLFSDKSSEKFSLSPMGSIAYKLARLSHGKIDFVISMTPKNIWDIAGGTLLCKSVGIKFWSEGKEVTEVKPLYQPPLIWCAPEIYEEISRIFR